MITMIYRVMSVIWIRFVEWSTQMFVESVKLSRMEDAVYNWHKQEDNNGRALGP